MYLEAIDRAQERIWLTHAYLLPDDDFVAALRDAARRGVDVRIIVPERSNHVVADWLSRGFYDLLLRSGIRLFLYQDAMVHAKTGTIDGHWATIGTANLDRLSLWGNYEVNLEITDPGLAAQMEDIYRVDLSNCFELDEERWRARSLVAKATEAFLSPGAPSSDRGQETGRRRLPDAALPRLCDSPEDGDARVQQREAEDGEELAGRHVALLPVDQHEHEDRDEHERLHADLHVVDLTVAHLVGADQQQAGNDLGEGAVQDRRVDDAVGPLQLDEGAAEEGREPDEVEQDKDLNHDFHACTIPIRGIP
nr:phospholipase D-like domain-containing protein [Tessaracoccus coleopterorum]